MIALFKRAHARRFARERNAAAAVEFAFAAPLVLMAIVFVFQVGILMRAYSGLRSLSSDMSRHASVQYLTNNKLTDLQLQDYAFSTGTSDLYHLDVDQLDVTVTSAATSGINDVKKIKVDFAYSVPIVVPFFTQTFDLTYSRDLYVTSPGAT